MSEGFVVCDAMMSFPVVMHGLVIRQVSDSMTLPSSPQPFFSLLHFQL